MLRVKLNYSEYTRSKRSLSVSFQCRTGCRPLPSTRPSVPKLVRISLLITLLLSIIWTLFNRIYLVRAQETLWNTSGQISLHIFPSTNFISQFIYFPKLWISRYLEYLSCTSVYRVYAKRAQSDCRNLPTACTFYSNKYTFHNKTLAFDTKQ